MTKEVLVALVRGINVGTAKRVAMADLRAMMTEMGFGGVRTLLNSGNVVFTSSRGTARQAAVRIEGGLQEQLGVSAKVVVLTTAELAAIVERNPFAGIADDPSKLLVAVLLDRKGASGLAPLLEEDWGADRLALEEGAAYLWCPGGIRDSRLADTFMRKQKDLATTRNWATVLKLKALCEESA